jgi:hypothetical protein
MASVFNAIYNLAVGSFSDDEEDEQESCSDDSASRAPRRRTDDNRRKRDNRHTLNPDRRPERDSAIRRSEKLVSGSNGSSSRRKNAEKVKQGRKIVTSTSAHKMTPDEKIKGLPSSSTTKKEETGYTRSKEQKHDAFSQDATKNSGNNGQIRRSRQIQRSYVVESAPKLITPERQTKEEITWHSKFAMQRMEEHGDGLEHSHISGTLPHYTAIVPHNTLYNESDDIMLGLPVGGLPSLSNIKFKGKKVSDSYENLNGMPQFHANSFVPNITEHPNESRPYQMSCFPKQSKAPMRRRLIDSDELSVATPMSQTTKFRERSKSLAYHLMNAKSADGCDQTASIATHRCDVE